MTVDRLLGPPNQFFASDAIPGQLLGNALLAIRRVLEEGRSVLQDLAPPEFSPSSIEQELFGFLKQFSTGVVHCEVSVTGHRKELKPAVQEQINLMRGRRWSMRCSIPKRPA